MFQQTNEAHLFIEVYVRRGPQKLSVQCGTHKIPCWTGSDYTIRT